MSKRWIILQTIHDSVTDFLYYDRKEDEELKIGDIEKSIKRGEITVDEICQEFSKNLRETLAR